MAAILNLLAAILNFKMAHINSAAALYVINNDVSHKQSVVCLINQNGQSYIENTTNLLPK